MHLRLHAPATPDQKRLANRLNLAFSANITQGDMHLLLNEHAPPEYRSPNPTPAQIEFAQRIGVVFEEEKVTLPYLKALIDHEVVVQSKRIMQENPHLKVNEIISFEGVKYRICTIGPILDQPWRMRLSPVDGGPVRLIYVAELAHPRVP